MAQYPEITISSVIILPSGRRGVPAKVINSGKFKVSFGENGSIRLRLDSDLVNYSVQLTGYEFVDLLEVLNIFRPAIL